MTVFLFVCLFLCLSVSLQLHVRSSPNCSCLSPIAVTRSSFGGVAIYYVLPVLWMTLCLHIMAKNRRREKGACSWRPTMHRTGGGVWNLRSTCNVLNILNSRAHCHSMSVRLCVCLPVSISPELHVTYRRGSVLIWRRCNMSCTYSYFWCYGAWFTKYLTIYPKIILSLS